jgi:hypothetical protein
VVQKTHAIRFGVPDANGDFAARIAGFFFRHGDGLSEWDPGGFQAD